MAETEGSVNEWGMPYMNAERFLQDKYKATQEEIVLWIETKEITPKDGWCIINVGSKKREVLRWNLSSSDPDYVRSTLLRLDFNADEINHFVPKCRWISFKQIVERWEKYGVNSFDAAATLHNHIGIMPSKEEREDGGNLLRYQYPLVNIEEIEKTFPPLAVAQAETVGDDGAGSQADTEPADTKVIQANRNEYALSGLLHKPTGSDDWFEVIDVMTSFFYSKHKVMPTKAQAWVQLCTNPPTEYDIKPSDDKQSLEMKGVIKPFNKRSFYRRWVKYTAESNPFKPN